MMSNILLITSLLVLLANVSIIATENGGMHVRTYVLCVCVCVQGHSRLIHVCNY